MHARARALPCRSVRVGCRRRQSHAQGGAQLDSGEQRLAFSGVGLDHEKRGRARDSGRAERPREDDRDQRIKDEIIVDAYGPEEQAPGRYYYLDTTLQFPFTTRRRQERAISPLRVGDEVDVNGLAPAEECECGIFGSMRWERRGLAIPLTQIQVVHADDASRQTIEDWHYGVDRGYEFGWARERRPIRAGAAAAALARQFYTKR